ncbi:MAG: hypothetical protein CBC71_06200 [Rhodobacteraceae bacterium TMED111]|nr:hypothetical protein [Marinovum sp.]OUV41090.1 MAG: hypothetical protein CBC71_06200 [Rhodobacteraceae bacterium TMED111]|tara:strand:+ start:16 stop:378 length:363 start_codon:yes stop_codon:yes gene_type:complete
MTKEKLKQIDDAIIDFPDDWEENGSKAGWLYKNSNLVFIALQHLKESVESEQLDENGLKPCPFCKGKAWKYCFSKSSMVDISCLDGCAQASTGYGKNEEQAVKAWNTRPKTKTLKKWVEE